ncbi:MAG: M1 family aminopeptidase [Saprospiraceae bacterium]
MKFRLSFLFVLLFCSLIRLFSQPDQHIGCHHATLAQHTKAPSIDDLLLMENSNRRSDSIDILNYSINLDISDYVGKKINGFTEITFKTRLPNIESISLDLRELNISAIIYKNENITFDYDGELIRIPFKEMLPINHTAKIVVYYNGVPSRDPVWGGFYFENDYIYNLGIGLSSTPPNFGKVWFPCFDNFVERSTYDYIITTNPSMKAYCVGSFISEEILANGKIKRHYSMLDQIPTYLSNIAAANYAVSKYTHQGKYGPIPVEYIAKPANIAQMGTQFANMPKAIDALEFWFGRYRFERVGYVATTVGAMEHPTNTAFPISSITQGQQSSVEQTMAHELGHHWWGDLTTLDDARDMWIKEGTAEYSSHLFQEYTYGKEHFIRAIKGNLSDIIKNAHRSDGDFLPLSPMPYEHTYGTHTYRKGAAMIHNMRTYMGDTIFRKASHTVFDSLTGKSMNAYEFRDFLNKNSGVDMTDYFNDFIFNPGYLGVYIDSFFVDDQNVLTVYLHQKSYRANHLGNNIPILLTAYNEQWKRIENQVRVSGENTKISWILPTGFDPKMILINERQNLNLAAIQSNTVLTKSGAANFGLIDMTSLNVSSLTDSILINIAHHYVGPSGTEHRATNLEKISNTHFWQVNAISQGVFQLSTILEYNGVDKFNLDFDLIPAKEDSLLLVFRPDWKSPWVEYPFYNKLGTNLTDKKGLLRVTKLLPGEYTMAYGAHVSVDNEDVAINEIKVQPNPVLNKVLITDKDQPIDHISVYSLQGNLLLQNTSLHSHQVEMDLSNLPQGIYEFILEYKNGKDRKVKLLEKL